MTEPRIDPGTYWRLGDLGAEPSEPCVPDVVVCRRVADYPGQTPPVSAGISACQQCGERIAFNPTGPHQDKPKVCMQCASIQPLPIAR